MANLSNINNKFLVTTGGNVLIGQTSDDGTRLQVDGDAIIKNGTFGKILLRSSSNYLYGDVNGVLIAAASNNLRLYTASVERMRIESDGTSILRGLVKINTGAQASNPRLYFQHDNLDVNNFIEVDRGSGAMEFYNNGSERMRIDSAGNVGIGVTPEAWTGYFPVLQIGDRGALAHYANDSLTISDNWYYDGTNRRIDAGFATRIQIISATGDMHFQNAPTGIIDSAITFTTRLFIQDDGNVGIGTTGPNEHLSIEGSSNQELSIYSTDTGIVNTQKTFIKLYGENTAGSKVEQARISSAPGASASSAGQLIFNTGTGVYSGGYVLSEKMRIDEVGNVGIGTTTPGARLDVVNTGNYESIRIGNSISANVNKQGGITALNYIGNSTSIFQYATNAGANVVYYGSADGSFRGITQHSFMISSGADTVSHSTMLRINSASINAYLDQYIIKTTPTIILEGRNSGNSGAKLQFLGWANTHNNWELGNAMAGVGFQFRASATAGSTNFATVATINSSTGAYTATSDINKKKDFEESKIGLNEVMKLKPKLFRMKTENENSDKHLGFIAQEVKEVIPQAYLEEKGKDDTKFIGLQDRPIIAALTKAIQELKAEIDLLKNS